MKKLVTNLWIVSLFVTLLSCEPEPLQLQNSNMANCGGCQDIPPGGGTVGQPPSITSFSPASGYAPFVNIGGAGTLVTIYGSNFSATSGNNVVMFNGIATTVYAATSTTINTVVPAGATTGKITVTTSEGMAASPTDFVVLLNNNWSQVTDFAGLSRSAAVSFVVKNIGYVGTGFTSPSNNGNVVPSKDFWAYNPATDAWTQRADLPGPARGAAVGFASRSRGYITLGSNGTAPYTMRDLWEYYPEGNTWNQRADFPGPGRVYSTAFAIGQKGYVGTGIAGTGYLSDFWVYNMSTNQWIQKSDFGGGTRFYAGSFVIGNKGYIGIGQSLQGFAHDVWEYNAVTDTWTEKASVPGNFAPGGTLIFSIGKKGYAGGSAGQLWMFDPVANTWIPKANFPGSLASGVGFSIGAFGYIGLGYDLTSNSHLPVHYRYTPD